LGNPFLDFTEEITREWQARGFSQEQVRGSDRFCYARKSGEGGCDQKKNGAANTHYHVIIKKSNVFAAPFFRSLIFFVSSYFFFSFNC